MAENYKYHISGKGSWSRHLWAEANPDAYYLIDFTNLLSEKREFTVVLELYGNAVPLGPQLDAALVENVHLGALDRKGYKSNTYWHFARKTYSWEPNASTLSDFVIKCIEKDFHLLLAEVIRVLNQISNK